MWQQLLIQISNGDTRSLARAISLVENEANGFEELLQSLQPSAAPVIGITGPPGAGKSTITDGLIGCIINEKKRVAVLCVDPSSPFDRGALLGDRIRMNQWYNHPDVFIRSLATRGALGGLNPKIIDITDLAKSAAFDFIIIETVGVGQSEIEIAGIADITLVVLVPESGDDIQSMKAGLMEIADVFVVNKSDRPGAQSFIDSLELMMSPAFRKMEKQPAIMKTIASEKLGIPELYESIKKNTAVTFQTDRKYHVLAEKAYQLIARRKMKGISREKLFEEIKKNNIINVHVLAASLT